VFVVLPGSARLLKYACHLLRVTKEVFAKQIAVLNGAFGADANDVMNRFCRDKILNISKAYLRSGFADGSSSLPKDFRVLLRITVVQGTAVPLRLRRISTTVTLASRIQKTSSGRRNRVHAVIGKYANVIITITP